jgi:tetratricopeptide (TPR) repeat protein
LSSFLTYLEPEPHRKTFLKPFMRSSEFCSACHKVHLDKPVNNYRWLRGFNSYDNWQASGVSGEGARSFYYPEQPRQCADCHMPLVPSKDPAARNGMVHSHQFPGANTALPHVNRDERQANVTESFLKSGFITVDLFAATPAEDEGLQMVRRSGEGQTAMSTFAVGEEAAQAMQVTIREVGEVTAPLDLSPAVFRPGDTVRVDAVVRTRVIGHFFPSGTVDAFDVWLELEGVDADGRVIFHSGGIENDGKGAVDPGAHFYRSFMLDGAGNLVNKRNAWQARSVLYARLIPPGAADVVHYRIRIPADASGPITLRAKLNHRKFTHYYTQWSYSGQPSPDRKPTLDYDEREWSFDPADIPANVSGAIKDKIPVLPVTVLAQAEATLQVQSDAGETRWTPVVRREDWSRWNDWGIGMLLQGDLKGAEYAFRKATEADPNHPDGWLNVARALIQEGEVESAKPFLAKAMELNPNLGRVHFFLAMAQKADGDYEAALRSLENVHHMYPRDRVVLNEIGLVRFRLRDYDGSVKALNQVLAVDPEDLQAHYTLMLAYRGLGDREASEREQKLFRRFKADESAQVLTARQRRQSPEDNNERQAIHDHVSALPE